MRYPAEHVPRSRHHLGSPHELLLRFNRARPRHHHQIAGAKRHISYSHHRPETLRSLAYTVECGELFLPLCAHAGPKRSALK